MRVWGLEYLPPARRFNHSSLYAVTRAPFHASMLRPDSQAGPMHETAGVGKLVNAALLSLINEACVNVCCATLLSSELVGPACMKARSYNPRSRACRPSGKGSGEERIMSDVVPVYLYTARLLVSVFLYVSNPVMNAGRPPQPLSTPHTVGPGRTFSSTCGQGLQQPTNMQPGTFCYR